MSRRKADVVADGAAVQDTPVTENVQQAAAQDETIDGNEGQAVPAEIPAAYADYEELPAIVAASLGLNLRAGPATNHGVLETLPDGALVTVLPLPYGVEVKGWALIRSESGAHGWVMTEFLTQPPAEE